MRFERSKEWWMALARREGDAVVAAGAAALDPAPGGAADTERSAEETRIAFGKFVNLMRRRRGYSIDELADAAKLDPSELLVIENDVQYVPVPRTVFNLARFFDIPQPRLMQLAGLTVANDPTLQQEAVRFAARSEGVEKLTREESAALEAFVAILARREQAEE